MLKVTIITIVLNDRNSFRNTARSVEKQDYPVLEWIVIDGGSTDGTLEVINTYSARISSWSSEPDRGQYDAMNKGLAKATGEWVIFMNAGDTFAGTDSVSRVLGDDLTGYGVAYGDSLAGYSRAQVLKKAGKPEDLVKGMIFCHQAAFVRRNLINEQGFDLQYAIGADFDMIFSLFLEGCRFKYLPFPVAVVDVSGLSNRKMVQSAREHFAIAGKYRKLSLPERLYHHGFIAWVAMVSAVYKILPVKVMHRISNLTSNPNQKNQLT